MIVVIVGSQKFQFNRLLKKIDELIEKKIIKEEVFAQIGVSDYIPKYYEYIDYLPQVKLDEKIKACDIVISHAGTGSIIGAVKQEKKVIGIPRLQKYGEHVDDHQIQLINEFGKLGFIEPIYDIEELEKALKKVNKTKYKKYVSKNDAIIESINEFINN